MVFKEFSMYCLPHWIPKNNFVRWAIQELLPHFKDGKTKAQRGDMLYSGPRPECSSCQY